MQLNYDTWVPRIGESIKRRGDPEAPRHYVTGVKGVGAYRTVSIDQHQARWWATDMFEPFDAPVAPPPSPEEPPSVPARATAAAAADTDEVDEPDVDEAEADEAKEPAAV